MIPKVIIAILACARIGAVHSVVRAVSDGCRLKLDRSSGCAVARTAYLNAFPGYYSTGDSGRIDEDGYVYAMGCTDDLIKVAGHRLSTGQHEEALGRHTAVAEAAVIGIRDALQGQSASGFVTLKAGTVIDEETLRRGEVRPALVARQGRRVSSAGVQPPDNDRRGGRHPLHAECLV